MTVLMIMSKTEAIERGATLTRPLTEHGIYPHHEGRLCPQQLLLSGYPGTCAAYDDTKRCRGIDYREDICSVLMKAPSPAVVTR